MKKISKTVVITGISSGIGLSTAQAFLQKEYRVFGSVRKSADASRLQAELGANFTPLLFDVCDSEAIKKAAQQVSEILDGRGLGGLVNNAGIAIGGPLLYLPMAEFRKQLEVNVIGLMDVTQQFLPLLGARENHPDAPGKIINISSVSGKIAFPILGPYVASKHALEALSHSLRRELMLYGIDVIIIGPGAVKTPIWEKGMETDSYENTPYEGPLKHIFAYFEEARKTGLDANYLAREIVKIFEKRNPKARYAYVPGNLLTKWILPRILPHRLMDRFVGKSLGLK